MAISHAEPGEIIDVCPFGPAISGAKTVALFKSADLEVLRLVVPRDKEFPTHSTRGEITVQCLEGRVSFTTAGLTRELGAGQMLHLPAGQPHSLLGIDDASLLVTIARPGSPSTGADSGPA